MNTREDNIPAQVVLKTGSGKTITEASTITSRNIQQYLPSETTMRKAMAALEHCGFLVQPTSPTLTITGNKSLYEETFQVLLMKKEKNNQTYYVPNTKATVPPALQESVASIVFSEPVEFFG